MAAKKLTIEIDDALLKSLSSRFPDIKDKEKLAATLARLALSEWEQWFAARLRPKSISALAQERVQMIFADPEIYLGRQVTRGVLFNQFNLPYGEALYLERVFTEREQPTLNKASLKKIIEDLDKQLQTWKKDKNKKEQQSFTVGVDKLGQRLLQTIMQNATAAGSYLAPTESALAVHGYYNYTFSAEEAEIVLTGCKKLAEGYQN